MSSIEINVQTNVGTLLPVRVSISNTTVKAQPFVSCTMLKYVENRVREMKKQDLLTKVTHVKLMKNCKVTYRLKIVPMLSTKHLNREVFAWQMEEMV
jgi:hypothetical protein